VRDHQSAVLAALRLKKLGNEIVRVLGGREIHPIPACIGGFWRVPRKPELQPLVEDLKWARAAAFQMTKAVAGFPFPGFEPETEDVALSPGAAYPMCEGRVGSTKGIDIHVDDYERVFAGQRVKRSNALHSVVRERGVYRVGPNSRFNLNNARLPAIARHAAGEAGLAPPVRNPFKNCGAGGGKSQGGAG
jgi:coenzyme F420-reducing hydrogenase alpha subunit